MNLLVLLLWLILSYTSLYFLRIFLNYQFGSFVFNLLLFPGVIVHELSHFLMAATLGVPTGQINIFPHTENGQHHLGSVQIAHTDPLRESLIGAAPLIVSSIGLVALSHWQFPLLFTTEVSFTDLIPPLNQAKTWIWLYASFTLSNTMFTSKSDRRAWPFLIGVFLLILILLYALNSIRPIQAPVISFLTAAAVQLNIAFTITIFADLVILSLVSLIRKAIPSW